MPDGGRVSLEPVRAPRSELALRVGSGIVMVAVALAATWAGGIPFATLWLCASIAIAAEWMTMTCVAPRPQLVAAAALGLAALTILSAARPGLAAAGLAGGATLLALLVLARENTSRAWACAGFLYAAPVALVPLLLRNRADLGALAILWVFGIVWTTDIAAFFVGRRFGGPKLWPSVSPKKTWSGFAGGLVGATVAGATIHALASSAQVQAPFGLVPTIVVSGLASVACQFGDLFESALKRRFAVKDSSRLIPGHGGVMDRLDGFVAVMLLVGLALAGTRPIEG